MPEEQNHETLLSGLINEAEVMGYISSVHRIPCAYFLKQITSDDFKTRITNSNVNKCRNALN
jgi:hypothetical protein